MRTFLDTVTTRSCGGRGLRHIRSMLEGVELFVCGTPEGARGRLSVHVAEIADGLVLDDAQVVHGAAEGDLHGLSDAGRASLHHFDFVDGFVHPQRNHLGSRKPLPEEKDHQQAESGLNELLMERTAAGFGLEEQN